MKDRYDKTIETIRPIIAKLNTAAMKHTTTFVEGNYMFDSGSIPLDGKGIKHMNKQINLMNVCRDRKHIVEIGFNAGHSALLMLSTNPQAKYNFFDIGSHQYVIPCFDILNKEFKDTHKVFVIGDSTTEFSSYFDRSKLKYDLVHIDGNHTLDMASKDMENAFKHCKDECIVVLDDTEYKHLSNLFESFIIAGKIVEMKDILPANHRIGRFVKEPKTPPAVNIETVVEQPIIGPTSEPMLEPTSGPVSYLVQERKIHLIVQYYTVEDDLKRQNEIDECLRRNVIEARFDIVHLLCESKKDLLTATSLVKSYISAGNKVSVVPHNIQLRLSWSDATRYISAGCKNDDDMFVVANADIYFPSESIDKIRSIKSLDRTVLSLLRYDTREDGNLELFGTNKRAAQYHRNVIHGASQDCWVLNLAAANALIARNDIEFKIGGEHLCDSKINWIFRDCGFRVLNPSYEVISVHLHAGRKRNYLMQSDLRPPFHTPPPTTLSYFSEPADKTIILTYTTKGYIKYTVNLFRSLKKLGISDKLIVVCPDETTKMILEHRGINAVCMMPLVPVDSSTQISFQTEKFSTVTLEKLRVIYHYLDYGYKVIFTDSDVIFLKNCVDDLTKDLESFDVVFQSDTPQDKSNDEVCTGFLAVKPNEKTLKLFDPRFAFGVEHFRDDQLYLNQRVGRRKSENEVVNVSYGILGKNKYVNGSIFMNRPELAKTASIIHFNWVSGSKKWEEMKTYDMIFENGD